MTSNTIFLEVFWRTATDEETKLTSSDPERGSLALADGFAAAAAAANMESGSDPSKALDKGSTEGAGLAFPVSFLLLSRTIFFTSETLQREDKGKLKQIIHNTKTTSYSAKLVCAQNEESISHYDKFVFFWF